MLPTIEVNILTFLIFFGSVQALILAVVLVTSRKFRRHSGYYLALLLFAFALINMTSGFFLSGAEDRYTILQYTPTFLVTLIPVSFYFFIRYLVSPDHQYKTWEYALWIAVIIEFIHRLYRFGIFILHGEQPYSANVAYYFSSNIYESIAIIQTLSICIWAIYKLSAYEKLLYQNYAEVEDKSLRWLRSSLMAGLLLAIAWLISMIFELSDSFHTGRYVIQFAVLGLTILICYIGYAMILRDGLVDTDIFGIVKRSQTAANDDKDPAISSRAAEHLERLKKLIQERQLYKDPDLSMTKLALITELSNSYLSQIINQSQGQNFFDFINAYRVEEVKSLLHHPDYAHYTILGVAQEAGFKSKSTFNSVFKKMTGMTPSDYKKSLSKPSSAPTD